MSNISDNFTRADEDPLSNGGKWSQRPGSGAPCKVASNVAAQHTGGATENAAIWTGNAFDADQFVELTQGALGASGVEAIMWLRHDASLDTGYEGYRGSGNWIIARKNAGSYTQLASVSGTFSAGDVARLQVSGSGATVSLAILVNGSGVLNVDDTDANRITAAGVPGFGLYGTGATATLFTAGPVTGGPSGALSKTLDSMGMALAGTVLVAGAFAATLGSIGIAAAGQVGISVHGSLSSSLDAITSSAAATVSGPGVTADGSYPMIAPFLSTDIVTTPGLRVMKWNGVALVEDVGHTTAGIEAVPNITNGYFAAPPLNLDDDGGYRGVAIWDSGGGTPFYVYDIVYIPPSSSQGMIAIFEGSVTGAATVTTLIDAKLTQTEVDHWKDRLLIFTSGNLKFQAKGITAFDPTTDKLTFNAFTTAPGNGDRYAIL